VPTRYSFVNPLPRPRRADLTICGNQKREYVKATKMIESVADKMVWTITVRNTNNTNPKKYRHRSFDITKEYAQILIWGSDLRC
jgi:hypothetical protein